MRPARIRDNIMDKQNIEAMYDLRTITAERLHFLLSTAKDELVKYTNCREEVKQCERYIAEERKKKIDCSNVGASGCAITALIGGIGLFIWIVYLMQDIMQKDGLSFSQLFSEEEMQKTPLWALLLFIFIVIVIPVCSICFFIISRRSRRKNAQKSIKIIESNIEKYETKLTYLQEKAKNAMSEFKALLFIPDDYSYEYALTKMLKFVENKQASNWEFIRRTFASNENGRKCSTNIRAIEITGRICKGRSKCSTLGSRRCLGNSGRCLASLKNKKLIFVRNIP